MPALPDVLAHTREIMQKNRLEVKIFTHTENKHAARPALRQIDKKQKLTNIKPPAKHPAGIRQIFFNGEAR